MPEGESNANIEVSPTRAYDLLTEVERQAVDNYVQFAVERQRARRQRVLAALNLPIPNEYIRRSRQALNRPVLRAAIAERIQEEALRYDISPDRAIHEYASVAFSDITDFMTTGLYGEPVLKDLREIPQDKAGAIKTIECQPGVMGVKWKITLHDKLPALKELSDLMGMKAPERPAPLADYVKAEVTRQEQQALTAPEADYTELLEAIDNKERHKA